MADNVYPVETCVTFYNGARVRLVKDEPWDPNDPFVAARPDLFQDQAGYVRTTAEKSSSPVETATAAPEEKRRTKRAARKND